MKWFWSRQNTSQSTSLSPNEIEIQIALGTYLPNVWAYTCALMEESKKLEKPATEIYEETRKFNSTLADRYIRNGEEYDVPELCSKGRELLKNNDKNKEKIVELNHESDRLRREGQRRFFLAAMRVHGDAIDLQWTKYGCNVVINDNTTISFTYK